MTADDWILHLTRQVDLHPLHADAWCSLGQALHRAARLDAARDALDRALELNPNYVDAALSRCFVLGDSGLVREGYVQLRPMFGLSPDSFPIVFAIGVYCMRHGWHDTGLAQLRRAARLEPRSPFAARFLAAALEQLGDTDGARSELARATALASDLRAAAGLPAEAGEFATSDFYRSWPDPGFARSHVQAAQFLLQSERIDEAAAELALAHRRFTGHPRIVVEIGRMHLLLDRSDAAQRWFEAALTIDARCHDAHLELSYVHAASSRMDHAVESLRHAVELRPMFPDYRYGLGTLLLDLDRVPEAIDQLEQALILNPDHGHSALQLATAYRERGWNDEALRLLEAGVWRTWPETRTLQAELLVRAERWDEARALLEAVLREVPDFVEAREVLARCGA